MAIYRTMLEINSMKPLNRKDPHLNISDLRLVSPRLTQPRVWLAKPRVRLTKPRVGVPKPGIGVVLTGQSVARGRSRTRPGLVMVAFDLLLVPPRQATVGLVGVLPQRGRCVRTTGLGNVPTAASDSPLVQVWHGTPESVWKKSKTNMK